jgi:DNA repair protein RadC
VASELPIVKTDAELVAAVLGPGAGPELASAVVKLAVIPFWKRRRLEPAALAREFNLRPATARRLVALWDLAERWYPDERPSVTSPRDVLLLTDQMRHCKREQIAVVMLDTRHRLIGMETVAVGTTNASRLAARDVFAPALQRGAVSVVVAHNHPSGDPTPSGADRAVTRALRQAGEVLGVVLMDHIIVGSASHYSFAESESWHEGAAA